MKPIGRLFLVLLLLLGLSGCGKHAPSSEPNRVRKVRGPAVAGIWYPRHEKDLTEEVDKLLAAVKPQPALKNLRALICPHAGFEFSGPVAAVGYKQLAGSQFHTVILLGPSHYALFDGASLPDTDAYETPLGTIPISPKVAELAASKPFVVNPKCEVQRPPFWQQSPKELPPFGEDRADTWEHSLEAQLPFLQRTLKNFDIVPIVYGNVDPAAVAAGLMKLIDQGTLLVVSSDLSHYYPYDTAKQLDGRCVGAICELDPQWMEQQEACGKVPIVTLLHIAKDKGWKAKLLDLRNSGDTSGEKSRVVGYAAIAFCDSGQPAGKGAEASAGAATAETTAGKAEFTPEDRRFLLELARKSVAAAVGGQPPPAADSDGLAERLTRYRGCFVTLTIDGQLRGCIGSNFPQEPLHQGVVHMARSAAIGDPRFSRVTADELAKIKIEISVLTMPRQLSFATPEELLEKLRPGVDGVVLRVGRNQATYLPQVWEQLPGKEDFLGNLAVKAGMEKSGWRSPDAAVLVYQVEAFKESEN